MKPACMADAMLPVVFAIAASAASGATSAKRATLGPAGCVSLSRSPEGSCIIATNCANQDLSTFEFAFDCVDDTGAEGSGPSVVRHSFGVGGFDDVEEFDSEVKCMKCSAAGVRPSSLSDESPDVLAAPQRDAVTASFARARSAQVAAAAEKPDPEPAPEPAPAPASAPAPSPAPQADDAEDAKASATKEETPSPESESTRDGKLENENKPAKKAKLAADDVDNEDGSAPSTSTAAPKKERKKNANKPQKKAEEFGVRYGPKDCVSTYRSEDGHCIMKTSCEADDLKDYEFGLVCIDKEGSPVRHLFGKDSFDPVETFDTLISCEQCLGLEDLPADVALTGQVEVLKDEVQGLKAMVANMSEEVERLNGAVFGGKAKGDKADDATNADAADEGKAKDAGKADDHRAAFVEKSQSGVSHRSKVERVTSVGRRFLELAPTVKVMGTDDVADGAEEEEEDAPRPRQHLRRGSSWSSPADRHRAVRLAHQRHMALDASRTTRRTAMHSATTTERRGRDDGARFLHRRKPQGHLAPHRHIAGAHAQAFERAEDRFDTDEDDTAQEAPETQFVTHDADEDKGESEADDVSEEEEQQEDATAENQRDEDEATDSVGSEADGSAGNDDRTDVRGSENTVNDAQNGEDTTAIEYDGLSGE